MSENTASAPIVVGVDDEPESATALLWAVDEAKYSRRRLIIVNAYEWVPDLPVHTGLGYYQLDTAYSSKTAHEQAVEHSRTLVEKATSIAHERAPGLNVVGEAVDKTPYNALIEAGTGAAMLVLGSHGRGLLGRMLLGSVSTAVTHRPPCPVVVIREGIGEPFTRSAVVVGVGGRTLGHQALDFAVEYAIRHAARLVVVHSRYPADQSTALSVLAGEDPSDRRLRDLVSALEGAHPGLDVTYSVTERAPAQALIDWSEGSRLVVIGVHGHRTHLGSVGQALVHHAWSPVALVPEGPEKE